MDARAAYIALNMMEGVGPITVRSLISTLGTPHAIFSADKSALMQADGVGHVLADLIVTQRDRIDPDAELRKAETLGITLVTPADPDYPKPLAQIYDPPLALYVRGTLLPTDKRALGIVGSRHTTIYGRDTADRLAYQMAQAGFVVVSGLARGIDTAAHQGALKGHGRTIAVLGGAIDRLYPKENAELAAAISGQGAVISEFALGREPDRTTFPIRNRIVSGLSMGVVVVEAGLQSGALITVNQALEQGRTVFAVPGRIDSAASKGPHQLIKNGARLVESIDDILQEFEFLIPPSQLEKARTQDPFPMPPLTPDEERITQLLKDDDQDIDVLTRTTGIAAGTMSALLIGLEMKRAIRLLPGRRVALRRR